MSATDPLAPLPNEARMDAYYYGFERTGVGFIDAILSAVAIAGKGSHHTESWNEESDYGYYANRPGLPDATSAVELIQKAAEAAAANVAALLAASCERPEVIVEWGAAHAENGAVYRTYPTQSYAQALVDSMAEVGHPMVIKRREHTPATYTAWELLP